MTFKVVWIAAALLASACAPQSPAQPAQLVPSAQPAAPKRLIAAIKGDPPALNGVVISSGASGSVPGMDAVEQLLMVGVGAVDIRNNLSPRLAEGVPSIENGLWRVLPDGHMEMTWKIKPQARWHDGAPFTADDLAFALTVANDNEVAIFRDARMAFIESYAAPDPQTFTVRWKSPYIEADKLFVNGLSFEAPMPKHLLEKAFNDDRANFKILPYWTDEFVGTGPFKVRTYERGSHLILDAFDGYILGRPKLDEMEVRFINDGNTLVANLLSGTVDVALGRSLSLDQATYIRDNTPGTTLDIGPVNWMALYPQYLNPGQPLLADVRFRRALYYDIDRQELVDSIQGGLGGVAHSILIPDEPEYADVQNSIVRYEYDPRRAAQMIEDLGNVRTADGFHDATGQKLAVDIRASDEDINAKIMFPVADYWQRLGLAVTTSTTTPEQRRNRAYRAQYPGFEVVSQGHDVGVLPNLRSSEVPTAETNFVGENRSRYASSELDALLERYLTTIPKRERAQALAPIVHFISDQLVWMGLFNRVDGVVKARGVENIYPRHQAGNQGWNGHEWDIGF